MVCLYLWFRRNEEEKSCDTDLPLITDQMNDLFLFMWSKVGANLYYYVDKLHSCCSFSNVWDKAIIISAYVSKYRSIGRIRKWKKKSILEIAAYVLKGAVHTQLCLD